MSEWKDMLKTLEKISKDEEIDAEKREKAKNLLKNKKDFFKFYIDFLGVKEKEDVIKASEQKIENDKKSILNNTQLTKQRKEELLKDEEKYVRKIKKELKELIEWSKE